MKNELSTLRAQLIKDRETNRELQEVLNEIIDRSLD